MKKRRSILFINRVFPPHTGATGRMLRDLARAFARQGWEVSVLTTGEKKGTETESGLMIHRLRAKGEGLGAFSYALIWLRLLIAALRLPRYDVVVSMTDPPMQVVIGRIAARL